MIQDNGGDDGTGYRRVGATPVLIVYSTVAVSSDSGDMSRRHTSQIYEEQRDHVRYYEGSRQRQLVWPRQS